MSKSTKSLNIILTILVIVIAWTIFAPLEVGGKVKYVIIDGTSMLPNFVNGDLVVVRQTPYYEVGDVVAYSYPGLGTVIHRIVEKQGNKFVLKGDNNTWIDGYYPTADEIYGKLWIHIPGAGKIILKLKEPVFFALLIGIGAYLVGIDYVKADKSVRRRVRD